MANRYRQDKEVADFVSDACFPAAMRFVMNFDKESDMDLNQHFQSSLCVLNDNVWNKMVSSR